MFILDLFNAHVANLAAAHTIFFVFATLAPLAVLIVVAYATIMKTEEMYGYVSYGIIIVALVAVMIQTLYISFFAMVSQFIAIIGYCAMAYLAGVGLGKLYLRVVKKETKQDSLKFIWDEMD